MIGNIFYGLLYNFNLSKSYCALLAQLVERIHGKDEVTSSILVEGSNNKKKVGSTMASIRVSKTFDGSSILPRPAINFKNKTKGIFNKFYFLPFLILLNCFNTNKIFIDGSSTVFPILESMIETFSETKKNTIFELNISGTGEGINKFCKNKINISLASRKINDNEKNLCSKNKIKFLELPLGKDVVVLLGNKNNKEVDNLTIEELKKLYTDEKIQTWQDIRPNWPNRKIKLYSTNIKSSNRDLIFKELLETENPSNIIRKDLIINSDQDIITYAVVNEQDGIAIVSYEYYFVDKDKFKIIPIIFSKNKKIITNPTAESIKNGLHPKSFISDLYLYVNLRHLLDKPDLQSFLKFFFQNNKLLLKKMDDIKLFPLDVKDYEKNYNAISGLL